MNQNHDLLIAAARALGPDVLKECAFVGGCTVHLYLDDPSSAIGLRATEDVDIIVEVQPASIIGYHNFSEKIRDKGFVESAGDGPMCRFQGPGGIVLDVLATDEQVLSFGNRWYAEAFSQADSITIAKDLEIRFIRLEHFIATKLTAWKSRADGDIFHRDIEDILTVIDGRRNIETALEDASRELKDFVREGLLELSGRSDFRFLIEGGLGVYRDAGRVQKAYATWANLALRLKF